MTCHLVPIYAKLPTLGGEKHLSKPSRKTTQKGSNDPEVHSLKTNIFAPQKWWFPSSESPFPKVYLGVSKNNGTPKSSMLIGCSIIFTIHFGVFLPIFGLTPIFRGLFAVSFSHHRPDVQVSLGHPYRSKSPAGFRLQGGRVPRPPPPENWHDNLENIGMYHFC